MRASEIRQLIRMKPVELDTTRRRLGACHDIDDLRAMGERGRKVAETYFDRSRSVGLFEGVLNSLVADRDNPTSTRAARGPRHVTSGC